MEAFLNFCVNYYILFWILAFASLFGICGYFIDHNTNILSIEKKKKLLVQKNMNSINIKEIKEKLKDKNMSIGQITGNDPLGDNSMNNLGASQQGAGAQNQGVEEDLTVPFKLQ